MTDEQEQEQVTRYRRRIVELKELIAKRDATIAGKDAALRELGASGDDICHDHLSEACRQTSDKCALCDGDGFSHDGGNCPRCGGGGRE